VECLSLMRESGALNPRNRIGTQSAYPRATRRTVDGHVTFRKMNFPEACHPIGSDTVWQEVR